MHSGSKMYEPLSQRQPLDNLKLFTIFHHDFVIEEAWLFYLLV